MALRSRLSGFVRSVKVLERGAYAESGWKRLGAPRLYDLADGQVHSAKVIYYPTLRVGGAGGERVRARGERRGR